MVKRADFSSNQSLFPHAAALGTALADNELVGVFRLRLDSELTPLYANRRCCALLGWEDDYGWPLESLRALADAVAAAAAAGRTTVSLRLPGVRRDGGRGRLLVWGRLLTEAEGGELIGCCLAGAERPSPGSDDIRALVRRHRSRLEQLAELASHDALTGLLNRPAIEQAVTRRLQALPPGQRGVLFMIDIDDFKLVNDGLGHQCGDCALAALAAAIRDVFRSDDVIGRLGGDEFMAFIAGNLNDGAIAAKATELCRARRFAFGGKPGPELSASVGAAICVGGKSSFAALYRLADEALYEAKRHGKNSFLLKYADSGGDEAEMSCCHPQRNLE